MSAIYKETEPPRFTAENIDGCEQISIPAARNIFLMLFLPFWLCMWTIGGVTALGTLLSKGFQPFLMVWLCGWALGEVFALTTLLWLLTGSEIIRIIGADLEISYRMLGLARRSLYRGSEIQALSSQTAAAYSRSNQMPHLPIVMNNKTGSVKFNYGARTVYVAPGLDEAEGRLIVERLRKFLPSSASR